MTVGDDVTAGTELLVPNRYFLHMLVLAECQWLISTCSQTRGSLSFRQAWPEEGLAFPWFLDIEVLRMAMLMSVKHIQSVHSHSSRYINFILNMFRGGDRP